MYISSKLKLIMFAEGSLQEIYMLLDYDLCKAASLKSRVRNEDQKKKIWDVSFLCPKGLLMLHVAFEMQTKAFSTECLPPAGLQE